MELTNGYLLLLWRQWASNSSIKYSIKKTDSILIESDFLVLIRS